MNFAAARALVLLVGGLLLWWLIPLSLKSLGRQTFFEFQAPSLAALGYLGDLQDYWAIRSRDEDEVIGAAIDLSRLNAAYAVRNQQFEAAQSEVQRLEAMLDLPPLPEHRYEVARVVRRDINGWWQSFVIRKGSLHGLRPGYAVVYRGGVVGRVREVYTYTSVVELLTAPTFRVAAHFEGDLRPVQFQGVPSPALGDAFGKVSNVPPDVTANPQQPRRLVSSRLGGVFPDGLTLGMVDSLRPGDTGLFQTGPVAIDPQLAEIREVAVLIPVLDDARSPPGRVRPQP